MLGNPPRVPARRRRAGLLFLVVICTEMTAVTSCMAAGTEKTKPPTPSSAQTERTPTSTPTPSTPVEMASAVRDSLRRDGTGTATVTSESGGQKATHRYTVSCDAPEPRMKLTAHVPGRDTETSTVDFPIIVSGSKLYVRQPKEIAPDPSKPWKVGKFSGPMTEIDTTFRQSTLDLYAANCDQPSAIARSAESVPKSNGTHTITGTLQIAEVKGYADGYAERFYRYANSFGATKLKYTLQLGRNFQPLMYRIASDGVSAEAASWTVKFSDWHAPQIKLPPKNETHS